MVAAMTTIFGNVTLHIINSTSMINKTNVTSDKCHPEEHHEHHFPLPLATILLLLIAIVALVGNSLVVLIISKIRQMQTFMNWMLFNLAVADLSASLFCLSVDVTQEFYKKWVFGKLLCHLLFPLRSVTIFTSIFTLMCLSISRYWAIMYPFRKQPSVKFAKMLISCTWLFSCTLALPYTLGLQYQENIEQCIEVWSPSTRKLYTVLTFIFTYIIPVIVITTAYAHIVGEVAIPRRSSIGRGLACMNKDRQRENRQLIKLSIIISSTFSCCVLPYEVVWILHEFSEDFNCFRYLNDTMMASTLLLYLGSALNPITYNIFSESFRKGFWELCNSIGCFKKTHQKRTQSSYSHNEVKDRAEVTSNLVHQVSHNEC